MNIEFLIKTLQDAVKPEVIEIGDKEYTTKEIYDLPAPTEIRAFRVHTLGGVIDYLNGGGADTGDAVADLLENDELILHVAGADKVVLYSRLDDRRRDCFLIAETKVQPFTFGRYLPLEDFMINLQTRFAESPDRGRLLKVIGNLSDEEIRTQTDDGVSQNVTVKTGIVKREEIKIENPVTLCARRTFPEVEQPAAPFIFRLNKLQNTVHAALFEADGGAWELAAVKSIADYLAEKIKNVRIIA